MLLEKVKALLGSIRFWIITLTAVIAVLEQQVTGTLDIIFVLKTVEAWLAVIATLGTIDGIVTKYGQAIAKRG